ncbi:MAG: hypothetical protein FWF23_00650 [Alphaproteobacteria bacterium]|nr:hypothetical protein [Alphaproteobacteria bacterium]MCL2505776.1 hypothetical protein [Alphaproteobacteria bacterium]
MKKIEHFSQFPRIWTKSADENLLDNLRYNQSKYYGDEGFPAMTSPANWGETSVSAMAPAACQQIPLRLKAVEENTVPSWLWRYKSGSSLFTKETDIKDVFNRVIGSAAAKAWKLGLFSCEKHARAFYDELMYAFLQRKIAVAPEVLSKLGLFWAYSIKESENEISKNTQQSPALNVANSEMDKIFAYSDTEHQHVCAKKMWGAALAKGKEQNAFSTNVVFSDISADWLSSEKNASRAAIDLFSMLTPDGTLDIEALCHTTRLLTILLDLQGAQNVSIGIANLSSLLMSLGLLYDSDGGRALAGAIMAIISAQTVITSAELSMLRGIGHEFIDFREETMRMLRNRARAAFGDSTDYEKISVLPSALSLKNCPDLVMLATAQKKWKEALQMVQDFGLRAIHTTDLTPSPVLKVILSCSSQGIEPMGSLINLVQEENQDTFKKELHQSVLKALRLLKYSESSIKEIAEYACGSYSIRKTNCINSLSLEERGLDKICIERIESYIPCVDKLELAVTPWVIGVEYCAKNLHLSEEELDNTSFSLLRKLGFSEIDIKEANNSCYGMGTLRSFKNIDIRHRPLFACEEDITIEAKLKMAGAVQAFVSYDVGAAFTLPVSPDIIANIETIIVAWQYGIKSVNIVSDDDVSIKQQHIRAKKLFDTIPTEMQVGKVRVKSITEMKSAKREFKKKSEVRKMENGKWKMENEVTKGEGR